MLQILSVESTHLQMFLTTSTYVWLENTRAFLEVYSLRPSPRVPKIEFKSPTSNSMGTPPTLVITQFWHSAELSIID